MNRQEKGPGIQTNYPSVTEAKDFTTRLRQIINRQQTYGSILSMQEQQMRRLFPSYRLPQEPKYPRFESTRLVGPFIVGNKPLNLGIKKNKNNIIYPNSI